MVLLGEQRQKAAACLSQAWDAGILHLVATGQQLGKAKCETLDTY